MIASKPRVSKWRDSYWSKRDPGFNIQFEPDPRRNLALRVGDQVRYRSRVSTVNAIHQVNGRMFALVDIGAGRKHFIPTGQLEFLQRPAEIELLETVKKARETGAKAFHFTGGSVKPLLRPPCAPAPALPKKDGEKPAIGKFPHTPVADSHEAGLIFPQIDDSTNPAIEESPTSKDFKARAITSCVTESILALVDAIKDDNPDDFKLAWKEAKFHVERLLRVEPKHPERLIAEDIYDRPPDLIGAENGHCQPQLPLEVPA